MSRAAGFLLAARLTSALTTLAVLSMVARLEGAEALGLVALGFAAGPILATLTEVGVGGLLVREGAREPETVGELLGGLLAVRVITVPFVLGGAWLALRLAFGDHSAVVWLAAAGLVFQQWAELTRSVSLSRGRVGLLAAHTITENLVWLAVIGAVLLSGFSLATALAGGVLVCAASVLAGLVVVRIGLGVRPGLPAGERARQLASLAPPFAIFALLGSAAARIDTILVGLLVPGGAIVAAGAYFAATRLIAALEYLPETLSRSLLPDLSRTFVEEPAAMRAILQRPARLLLFAGIPVPFAMAVFGPWLMEVLFGEGIGNYGWLVVGLAALVPFRFFSWLFGVTLTGADAQWRRVGAVAAALVAVSLVDAALLPRIGVVAALGGAVVSTLTVAGLYAYGVRRLVGSLSIRWDAARALLAAVAAMAASLAIRSGGSDLAGAISFAVVYGVAVLASLRVAGLRRPLVRPEAASQ